MRATDASRSSAMRHAGALPLLDDRDVPVGPPSNHCDHRLGDGRADALGRGELLLGRPSRIAAIDPNSVRQRPRGGGADVADRERRPAPARAGPAWPGRGWRAAARRWPTAPGRRARRPRPSSAARVNSSVPSAAWSSSRSKTSPSSCDDLRRPAARRRPRSRAPRCRRRRGRRRGRPAPSTWAGQRWWLGQRRSLSPSFCCASVVPHDGHSVGITHFRRPSGRSGEHRPDDLGDDVAGLAQDDGVAGADVLALDLVGVVQGGVLDRRAGDPGRLHHAVRRHPARAADVDPDLEQLGVDLLGRVLERDRPARRPRWSSRAAAGATTSSTFTTTPSIS